MGKFLCNGVIEFPADKMDIVAKKCYPQNSSRASIRHTDHIKLITGGSG